ncbi:hypothetical protein HaLaN_17342, partial [Haematococcus lacustris]
MRIAPDTLARYRASSLGHAAAAASAPAAVSKVSTPVSLAIAVCTAAAVAAVVAGTVCGIQGCPVNSRQVLDNLVQEGSQAHAGCRVDEAGAAGVYPSQPA